MNTQWRNDEENKKVMISMYTLHTSDSKKEAKIGKDGTHRVMIMM
jgi:hypothetical protein